MKSGKETGASTGGKERVTGVRPSYPGFANDLAPAGTSFLVDAMPSGLPERKPWPMKWVILAIVVSIGGYTFLTLHYRKNAAPYRPYEDMKKRVNTRRLIDAGYQRIPLVATRPADLTLIRNTALPAPGGLPSTLGTALVSPPQLPSEIVDVQADGSVAKNAAYQINCRLRVADERHQLGSAELYVHGEEIVITPDFDPLGSGLEARSRESVVTLTIPAGALNPGHYRVTLVGAAASRAWPLDVK
jgi:hypothetical protein